MADPVSLTAAAAGFIGLAGQLAQGVIKLKEIDTTINDAHRDVASLCSKMEALQGVLEEVGDQMQQLSRSNINLDTRTLRDVITQCETSRYRVEAHVKKFSDSFRHGRGVAVKYVFKKKEVQEMLSDLEQCKTSLILARQSIDGAISSYHHEALLQQHATLSTNNHQLLQHTSRVETIVSNICKSLRDLTDQFQLQHNSNSSQTILARIDDIQRDIHSSTRHLEQLVSRRADESHSSSTLTTKKVKLGFQSMLFSFSVEFSSEQESQQTKDETVVKTFKQSVCTIRLPNWFVQDQYSLAIARSKNGWLFHPSMRRTVEYDSPFIVACRSGDLERIKMLLTTKQAFLSDRYGSRAESALNAALLHKSFEACELLVKAGTLSFFQSYDYAEAMRSIVFNLTSKKDESREILRLIEQEQKLDPDWMDDVELRSDYYKVIHDLRLHAEEAGDSALGRFEARMLPTVLNNPYFGSVFETELDWISEFLGDEDNVHEVRATASCSTWLLFVVAHKISHLFWIHRYGDLPEHAVRTCRFALAVLCDTELDLNARMGGLPKEWRRALYSAMRIAPNPAVVTPFAYIFARWQFSVHNYFGRKVHGFERLEEAMRLWVSTLHDAGVDLKSYAENEVWTINRILMRASANGNVVYTLLHGPEPDDWRIVTGRPGEAYPAYFWRGIEATPIDEDLTTKVLDLIRRVEHPEDVYCDVPGRWEIDQDDLEESDWIIRGCLAFMEDSDLTQMEADLGLMDATEFYDLWDLSSVVKYWSYD